MVSRPLKEIGNLSNLRSDLQLLNGFHDSTTSDSAPRSLPHSESLFVFHVASKQMARGREAQGWLARVPPLPELPKGEAALFKPRLGEEVEALFAEAEALVAARPRRNTRLQILEVEVF